jgi:predicted GIY-YIG superfamily endonuclease
MTIVRFYLIRHHDKPVYVGSTKDTLQNRLDQHFGAVLQRQKCKLYQAILRDPEEWEMELLEARDIQDTPQTRKIIETRLKKKWKTNSKLNETDGLC